MAVPISQLLAEQSTNYAKYTGLTTDTNKKWTKQYHLIQRLNLHTLSDDNRIVFANWEAYLPLFAVDDVRTGLSYSRPNPRRYHLGTEADCAVWFHTEVSNIVLSAWNLPDVLETNQARPGADDGQEVVDVVYALAHRRSHQRPLAIGEWKRNLIKPGKWRHGMPCEQVNLSRELRGQV